MCWPFGKGSAGHLDSALTFLLFLTSTLQTPLPTQALKKIAKERKGTGGAQNIIFTNKMQVGGYRLGLGRLATWLEAALGNFLTTWP